MSEADQLRLVMEDRIAVLPLQTKELEKLVTHVEQQTTSLE